MKFYKKLVVAATAATMVFGTVGSAFAAVNVGGTAFADVKADDKAADAFNVLAALGVYQGNEGIGGNVRPDSTITREEFSAVVVRFLDKDSTAKSLNTYVPSFTDASKISSWAWGYVNVASSLGIVNGYPNGEFRPQNPVTHAEAIAMLTRAVNVDKAATGTWPMNYVVLGGTVGITDDVDIVANVPATRAEVAQMTRNGYDVEHEWDADKEKLAKRAGGATFGSEETENQVNGVVEAVSATEITIEDDKTRDWASNAYVLGVSNINALVNLKVSAFLDKDGDVVAVVKDDKDTTVETGKLSTEDDLSKDRLVIDGTRYRDFANNVTVYVNNQDRTKDADEAGNDDDRTTGAEAIDYLKSLLLDNDDKDIYKNSTIATISLDKSNKVNSIRIVVNNFNQFMDDIDEDDRTISTTNVDGDSVEVEVTDDTTITLNGKSASFNDLVKAYDDFQDEYGVDVYPWVALATLGAEDEDADEPEAYQLAVYTETITGTVEGGGMTGKKEYVTIKVGSDSKNINLSTTLPAASRLLLSDLNGSVTLLIDDKGEAVAEVDSTKEANVFFAKLRGWSENRKGEVTSVRLQSSSETTNDYDPFEDDWKAGTFGDPAVNLNNLRNEIVRVTLDGGDVTKVEEVVAGMIKVSGTVTKITASYIQIEDADDDLHTLALSTNILVLDDGDVVSFSKVKVGWDVDVYLDANDTANFIERD